MVSKKIQASVVYNKEIKERRNKPPHHSRRPSLYIKTTNYI